MKCDRRATVGPKEMGKAQYLRMVAAESARYSKPRPGGTQSQCQSEPEAPKSSFHPRPRNSWSPHQEWYHHRPPTPLGSLL